jgi:hypothetical protein
MEWNMDSLAIAMIMAQRANAEEAGSALPNAPVVAYVDGEPVAPRTRRSLAGALRRMADAVAPALPAGH